MLRTGRRTLNHCLLKSVGYLFGETQVLLFAGSKLVRFVKIVKKNVSQIQFKYIYKIEIIFQ